MNDFVILVNWYEGDSSTRPQAGLLRMTHCSVRCSVPDADWFRFPEEISPQPQSSLLTLGARSPLVSVDSFASFRLRRQRTALTFSSLPTRALCALGRNDTLNVLLFRITFEKIFASEEILLLYECLLIMATSQ